MPNGLVIYIGIAIGLSIIVMIAYIAVSLEEGSFTAFPIFDIFPPLLKSHLKVNWFGAIFIYILTLMGIPLIAVISFLYWLSTVGVKNE